MIDNLNDIAVIESLLSENTMKRYTLIITRNPYTTRISAKSLHVPLFDMKEFIELLAMLSDIIISSESNERKQVEEIIKKLEYLPLAIEQVAAYVKEIIKDFIIYHEKYTKNHRKLLR